MARQQPGNEQIIQRLDSSVKKLDELRGESLQRTELLQTNKDRALKKEQQRLEKKHGADHPRVARINNRIEYNRVAIPEVRQEIEIAKIRIPDFDSLTWMVHGRVLNSKLEGVGGLTVSLFDASGKPDKDLGYACTDEAGYYAIRYRFEEDKEPPFGEDTPFRLTVSGDKGKICHQEAEPLFVEAGQVDFRQIIIDEKTCTPPPGWNDGDDNNDDDDDDDGQVGSWGVTGSVRYPNGKPGAGLKVGLVSKPGETLLLEAETGAEGNFRFELTTRKFPDLFKLKTPLLVVVSDQNGQRLYVSREPLMATVGGEETLNIKIKGTDDEDGEIGVWTVTGDLVYADGQAGSGLQVDLLDRATEARLVGATTGRTGQFKLELNTQKFPDVLESKPELLVVVSSPDGKRLHVTDDPLRAEAGVEKKLNIRLKHPDNQGDEDDPQAGSWVLAGTVAYEDGRPAANLKVDLVSREPEADLASVETGRRGQFKIELNKRKFPDVFELNPKLYVIVSNQQGARLYASRRELQAQAGGEEQLNIKLRRTTIPRR